jgi:hypothetical protein
MPVSSDSDPSTDSDKYGISRGYHDHMIKIGYTRVKEKNLFPYYVGPKLPHTGGLRRMTTTWTIDTD